MPVSCQAIADSGNPLKFYCLETATEWRAEFGGWIFAGSDESAIWFPASWTPSAIIGSDYTRGLSGRFL